MTTPKPDITPPPSLAAIIDGLETARQKNPDLAETVDLHLALLEAQGRVQAAPGPALPARETMEQALEEGVPLFHLAPPSFDWPAASQLAADVCRIVAGYRPDLADGLAAVSHYLTGQEGQIERLATRYLNGESLDTALNEATVRKVSAAYRSTYGREDNKHTVAYGEGQPPDQDLLIFVLNHTLRPFLQSAARNFQPAEPVASIYSPPSTCPMCGGPPDFAALVSTKNSEGHGRRLLCARCDTEWGYQRSGCPFCGQAKQWAYFPDENEVFRLYVCDACHHYLKTVDQRQTFAHRSLPVARVITVGMDLAAVRAGYTSPSEQTYDKYRHNE
ncbi:MAG: formate dehydrogenase accessory protein FdhE [Anaerolineae bacterium]